MLEMLMQWYRRRFSDPEAIALLVILVAGFGIIFSLVACLLRCWWLLCWPICWNGNRAPAIYWLLPPLGDVDCIGGFVGILLLMAFVVLPIARNRAST